MIIQKIAHFNFILFLKKIQLQVTKKKANYRPKQPDNHPFSN